MLWPFGIFHHVGMVIWYIFPSFGMLHQEKSGNPEFEPLKNPLSSKA
jgi:hypothetical protein